MQRTKAYRRHQDRRVINKRKKIAKEIDFHYDSDGSLRKQNLVCSCGMCDVNHPFKCKKGVLSDKELHRIKNLDDDMMEK